MIQLLIFFSSSLRLTMRPLDHDFMIDAAIFVRVACQGADGNGRTCMVEQYIRT